VNTSSTPTLSIGDLAERTGVAPATLRMWEQRHGFPVPERLDSGHRRYAEADVESIRGVLDRRDAGSRLDAAIADVLAARRRESEPGAQSVWAELRRRHREIPTHRLTKQTLLSLSWAIEDEFAAKAERAHLFGLFQHEHYYSPARRRWDELARVAGSSYAFFAPEDEADLGHPEKFGPTAGRAASVPVLLDDSSPVRREWAVVCDSVDLPVVLTAWELPGQEGVADRDRVFESAWSIDPMAVRRASRTCAALAAEAGAEGVAAVQYALADDPAPVAADLAAVSALFSRVVAYVDDGARRLRRA
jgi:DNA-binding transcriptional MerR regulator